MLYVPYETAYICTHDLEIVIYETKQPTSRLCSTYKMANKFYTVKFLLKNVTEQWSSTEATRLIGRVD